jgi:hypothetical protein
VGLHRGLCRAGALHATGCVCTPELVLGASTGGWALVGVRSGMELVSDFLPWLSDRNHFAADVRSYAFDLRHVARWLAAEEIACDAVDSDALLRYLTGC